MPAVYIVLAVVALWMTLGQLGALPFTDRYPYPYLLFWDNVIQVALCSAILVGQSVLRQAADRRSVQTYEGAEATFEHVAALHAELDQQVRALSRGVSLLHDSPSPRVEEHRVSQPPRAIDQEVGLNGRIAAALMQRLGSMPAVYLILGFQLSWIGLYYARLQTFDPYPFAFMTFLSTLTQLLFMIIIMVGQDVNERAGDSRSMQTYLDTQATLYELGRLRERLAAHGELVAGLADYNAANLIEELARAIHAGDSQARWEDLPQDAREASRAAARQIGDQLAAIGCLIVPADDPVVSLTDGTVGGFTFTAEEIRKLGSPDHGRAISAREARSIPIVLAGVGFQVQRIDHLRFAGLGRADFTDAEWKLVLRAPMAAGVLVSLAEGVMDPEEMDALYDKLRRSTVESPQRLIREVAAHCDLRDRPGREARYGDYLPQARIEIGNASDIIGSKGATEQEYFRQFLIEIGEAVADANREGGFFGLGARYRTASELAAIEVIRQATEYRG